MLLTRRQFVGAAAGLVLPPAAYAQQVEGPADLPADTELVGKTICGYQGWFNAEGDGRGLGFRHYDDGRGRFEPGRCTIDLWPDVSELPAEARYDTPFRHADGRVAQVFSSADAATADLHFDWMRAYGIDGVAVQRFGASLRNDRLRGNRDKVVENVRAAARRTGRLWMNMYDLSGMRRGEPQERVAGDWRAMVEDLGITNDPTYLRHNGKPIVSIWGVGFNDSRDYTLEDCAQLIERVAMGGRFSVMLGVPYYWRLQERDTVRDPELHDILRKADILSPWAVGRFGTPDDAIRFGREYVAPDLAWCQGEGKLLLPVIFPGFSWHNMHAASGREAKLDQIPRLGGRFLWAQAEAARAAGAEALYVAMFDEVDEATAVFKCTNDPPVGDSPFLTYKGLPSDHYLWLTGRIAGRLRTGSAAAIAPMPERG